MALRSGEEAQGKDAKRLVGTEGVHRKGAKRAKGLTQRRRGRGGGLRP